MTPSEGHKQVNGEQFLKYILEFIKTWSTLWLYLYLRTFWLPLAEGQMCLPCV